MGIRINISLVVNLSLTCRKTIIKHMFLVHAIYNIIYTIYYTIWEEISENKVNPVRDGIKQSENI